jgi:hypothetical protein
MILFLAEAAVHPAMDFMSIVDCNPKVCDGAQHTIKMNARLLLAF